MSSLLDLFGLPTGDAYQKEVDRIQGAKKFWAKKKPGPGRYVGEDPNFIFMESMRQGEDGRWELDQIPKKGLDEEEISAYRQKLKGDRAEIMTDRGPATVFRDESGVPSFAYTERDGKRPDFLSPMPAPTRLQDVTPKPPMVASGKLASKAPAPKPVEVSVGDVKTRPDKLRNLLMKLKLGPRGVAYDSADDPTFVQLADMPEDHPFRAAMEKVMIDKEIAVHGLSFNDLTEEERDLASGLFAPALKTMSERKKRAEQTAREEIARGQRR